MQKDFATQNNNSDLLPQTVSMKTLLSIVKMTDYFVMRPACELLLDSTRSWLDTFKRDDGMWALPKSMKGRMMQWYCVAGEFEEYNLMETVKHSILHYCPGTVDDSFGWPVRKAVLEGIEQDRGWYRFD